MNILYKDSHAIKEIEAGEGSGKHWGSNSLVCIANIRTLKTSIIPPGQVTHLNRLPVSAGISPGKRRLAVYTEEYAVGLLTIRPTRFSGGCVGSRLARAL